MTRPHLLHFLLLCVFLLAAPPAVAQKVDNKYREFPAVGFKVKLMKDWSDVPTNERIERIGVIAQFSAEKGVRIPTADGFGMQFKPEMHVFQVFPQQASTESSEQGGGLRGKLEKEKAKELTGKDFVTRLYEGNLRMDEFREEEGDKEDFKIRKGLVAVQEKFRSYMVSSGGGFDVVFEAYTVPFPNFKVVFLWLYPAKDKKNDRKWEKAIEKCMKSLKIEEVETVEVDEVDSDSSYADLLAFHQHDVSQTPGWKLIETPSKQYLIKTNTDDKKNLREVIKRLEASRKLFEEDFPPEKPITQISVVRICATRDEFNTYGQTGGGVAGYFNPGSEELVLFFEKSGNDMTLAVMTHEGFHQYCHFLFERSEAHRWFDEGHGDYYGAFKMRGSSLSPNKDMKGGLARVPIIKAMVRDNTYEPISRHIRFSHREWQSQGGGGVLCYSQSFSIIYFLREGTRGKVSSKYWKKEYADILPSYIKYLNQGFRAAYDEIREESKEALELLKENEGDSEAIELMEERIKAPWDYLDPQTKREIWDMAMAESWGRIDEYEFEERWVKYVEEKL